MSIPSLQSLIWAAIQVHEVGADPLDPKSWSGAAVGVGRFRCDNDGLSLDPHDPGNWTGGGVNKGVLGGTRWGIDSATYTDDLRFVPDELRATFPATVRDLALAQGEILLDYAYARRIRAADLSPRLSLLASDAAFNNGVPTASRWLQQTVGATVDGVVGDMTVAAVARRVAAIGEEAIAASFHALRIDYMARLVAWSEDGRGWSKRLARLPFQAERVAIAVTSRT